MIPGSSVGEPFVMAGLSEDGPEVRGEGRFKILGERRAVGGVCFLLGESQGVAVPAEGIEPISVLEFSVEDILGLRVLWLRR